ncbi:MAG: TolC family protein [Prolixibacteraceae bacterium]|nr:TolC family protein [Prolixibacteraceae bacterium]
MKRILLIITILAGCSAMAKAEIYNLTLEQSIEIAKKRSYNMLLLEQDLKIAEFNLKSATSRLKTHITMGLTTPEYTETIRQWEDSTGISFYSVQQLNYAGNVTVNQPLPTNGNIYLETGLSSYDDFNTDIRSTSFNTRLRFRQPIDALYGYNSIKSNLKRAQLNYERSSKSLKRQELNLIYQVTNAYYNLLSLQRRTQIASLDLERQTEANEISKNKFEAGLIREVDALQMEVDLAEAQNSYDIAIFNEASATNSFKELIGIALNDEVTLSSDLKEYKIVAVDPERAVMLALQNRMEIREQEIQITLQELNIKQQKAAGMISGNLNAYFEKIGVSRQDINVGYSTTLQNSFNDLGKRPANFGIGFSLSIPILDWGENRALVRAAQASQKQNELRKEELQREIETEVRNLVANINNNLKRLQLLEKNVEVAEKSFNITRQRFSDGDIDSQALALERNRLNNAYTSHLGAYINYQLTLADLMRRTFYDFQNDVLIQ